MGRELLSLHSLFHRFDRLSLSYILDSLFGLFAAYTMRD